MCKIVRLSSLKDTLSSVFPVIYSVTRYKKFFENSSIFIRSIPTESMTGTYLVR